MPGRGFHFRWCKDTTKKMVLIRICPYLRKKLKYSIFAIKPLQTAKTLAKEWENDYLCNVAKQLRSGAREDISGSNAHSSTIFPQKSNDHQKLSKIAHRTSVFTRIEPGMANRRLRRWINGDRKLCEELRKVGFFDHQHDHFFAKKEVELLFEYIGEPIID